MKQALYRYLPYVVLAVLMYFPLFGHLDSLTIRLWDESRLAINAFEMYRNGNWIVTHFDGEPDMWNTKPPLMICLQVLCMKVLGVNELAVRLPSALAALSIIFLLLLFSKRYLGDIWLGVIAIMVLLTSSGYIGLHASRTGDYDALLTLFTTMAGLSFLVIAKHGETRRNNYLYIFFVSITLAMLTKGVAGLLITPGLFVYALVRRQVIPPLRKRAFYISLLLTLAVVCSYYLLREMYNPGYLAEVWENELGGRYLETQDFHKHTFWFYHEVMLHTYFKHWYLLVFGGIAVGLASRNERMQRFAFFSLLFCLSLFLILSSASTRIFWYAMPLYPFMAFFVAFLVFTVFNFLRNATYFKTQLYPNVLPYVFLFFLFLQPYVDTLNRVFPPTEEYGGPDHYEVSHFLRLALDGDQDVEDSYLLIDGYTAPHLFYVQLLQKKGVNIEILPSHEAKPHSRVIVFQPHMFDYLAKRFDYEVVHQYKHIKVYELKGRKEAF